MESKENSSSEETEKQKQQNARSLQDTEFLSNRP